MMNGHETSSKSKSVFTDVYVQKRGTFVTVVILGFMIGIFAFAYITFGNESLDDPQRSSHTLKLVNLIINTGQTSPKFTYPTDLYRNDSRWHVGLGELSRKGKQNMYSLGKFFRERYNGFLPDLYFSSDLEVLSSNADACLMSAAVFLAGLYPPHKFQIWNPHVLWQPIPIKGISEEVDKMLDVTQHCPQMIRKIEEIGRDVAGKDRTLPKLYEYLTECTGMKVQNLSTILALYNLLNAQERDNLQLPEWSKSVYPKSLLKYAIKALQVETENIEITKLSTGILIEKIVSDSIKKREDAVPTKLFLYSAHEKSIVNMMRILDKENFSFSDIKPEFSSAVIVEVHSIHNATVVKAYYLDKVGRMLTPVNITECGYPCFFDNFVKFSKTFIPHNWDEACSL